MKLRVAVFAQITIPLHVNRRQEKLTVAYPREIQLIRVR